MNICSIYKITNTINSKIYIGQTWVSLKERFRKHKYNYSSCVKLKRAIAKYGYDNFKIELITICATQKAADYWENYFIQRYDSIINGYNILVGGKTSGRKDIKLSQETKNKLSKAAMGRKHSKETKLKLSKVNKGKIFSIEHREKISNAKIGKTFSKEHKDKLLGNHKGMTWKIIDGKRVWCVK